MILVVDDEQGFRKSLTMVLSRDGFSVVEASNPRDGFTQALAHAPQLVLLDLHLGTESGHDLLRWIRAHPATAHVPVVLMTGRAETGTFRESMALGADDFLPKPFGADELRQAVRSKLERQAAMVARAESTGGLPGGRFFPVLPHELKTPLHSILGVADLLRTCPDGVPAAEVREYGSILGEAGRRLLRLVENFLLHARLESGQSVPVEDLFPTPRRRYPVDEVVTRVARERANSAARESDLVVEAASVELEGVEDALAKVVEELVDNAFKFSAPSTPVHVSVRVEGEAILIVVKDRGRGMTPAQVASLGAYAQFERARFEQQGMGLGYVLARRLCGLMGGELTTQSSTGIGTVVSVRLSRN